MALRKCTKLRIPNVFLWHFLHFSHISFSFQEPSLSLFLSSVHLLVFLPPLLKSWVPLHTQLLPSPRWPLSMRIEPNQLASFFWWTKLPEPSSPFFYIHSHPKLMSWAFFSPEFLIPIQLPFSLNFWFPYNYHFHPKPQPPHPFIIFTSFTPLRSLSFIPTQPGAYSWLNYALTCPFSLLAFPPLCCYTHVAQSQPD